MLNKRFSTPFAQSLLLAGAIAVSLMVTSLLATLCAPLFGFTIDEFRSGANTDNPSLSLYLLTIQSIGLFLLPAVLCSLLITPKHSCTLLGASRKPLFINVLRSAFAMMAAVPFISFAANVNAQLPLPEWAKSMEEAASQLTEKLLLVSDTKSFLLNLLVMALLPAVCEEFFFRGYVQRLIRSWIKNPHIAIFTTALFFSAFHLQFAGFIPRFLLGALLGYLFYWSGSLWLPIVAHFTNNAIAVCTYFYVTYKNIPINSQEIDAAMQGGTFAALLSIAMVTYFMYGVFLSEKLRRKMQLMRKKMGGDGFTPII